MVLRNIPHRWNRRTCGTTEETGEEVGYENAPNLKNHPSNPLISLIYSTFIRKKQVQTK